MKNREQRINSYNETGQHDAALLFKISHWRFREVENMPLYPFAVEETIRRNRFTFSEKFCRILIVVLMLDGRLTYHSGNRQFVMEPGKLLLIPPGSDYEFSHRSGMRYHKLVLELKGTLLNSISSLFGFQELILLDQPPGDTLESEIRRAGKLLDEGDRRNIPELLGNSYSILYRLSAQLRETTTQPGILQTAQALLESNLAEPLNMEELPAQLGVSGTTLNRLFREKLNISPARYRNSCRIEYARELLLRSNLSIKEIAAMVGYCNQFYFSQEFRKSTGYAPLRYRREATRSDLSPFLGRSESCETTKDV